MFCRRTALLLEAIGVPEAHIDVDEHGGAAGVVAQLGRSEDYPLKGIPVVFAAVDAGAAVWVAFDRTRLEERDGKQYRTYVCKVGLGEPGAAHCHEFGAHKNASFSWGELMTVVINLAF